MNIQDSYNKIFKNINRILVVLAHPDDAEIVCGGLIARLIKDNKEVCLVITTNGGKGMKNKERLIEKTFAKARVKEQIEGGKILGVKPSLNFNLQIPDGEFEYTVQNIKQIVYYIRKFKPDIIITHNPHDHVIEFNKSTHWVNHRDHRNTGQIVLDAIYPYSRDRGFFPDHFEENFEPHIVNKILLADSYSNSDISYFDISKYINQKAEAIKKHRSAIDSENVNDYIEENRIKDKYFEPLLYLEVY